MPTCRAIIKSRNIHRALVFLYPSLPPCIPSPSLCICFLCSGVKELAVPARCSEERPNSEFCVNGLGCICRDKGGNPLARGRVHPYLLWVPRKTKQRRQSAGLQESIRIYDSSLEALSLSLQGVRREAVQAPAGARDSSLSISLAISLSRSPACLLAHMPWVWVQAHWPVGLPLLGPRRLCLFSLALLC